ncbi:MAG: hypothetical protein LRZ85_03885 [Alphaproteobacteria bacterium]|nr:hypothetical protein [Alphaproteobacteria bacterium]
MTIIRKRPLDPSDFEDDLYDDEFAFDENDADLDADLPDIEEPLGGPEALDDSDLGTEFEDTPEGWGDFEDPALSAAPASAAPLPGAAGTPKKQKSFIMKHFNTIVIGLGAILGIAVVGPQFLSGPGNVTSDMPQEEYAAPAVDTADGLPQPSPIAPAPAEEQAAATPDERLTPMPTPEIPVTEEAQTMDLAPLDPGPDLGFDNVGVKEGPEQTAELDDPTPPLPIEGATNIEKPVVELPDPIAFENQPIPTAAPPEEAPEEELASLPEPEVQETAPSPADPPQLTPPGRGTTGRYA